MGEAWMLGESEESLQRRARVIVYLVQRGEIVKTWSGDPVTNFVLLLLEERRREGLPCAAAEGATPFDW